MNFLPLAVIAVAYYALATGTEPLKPGEESFTLYYWNKCSHCRRMMPEFDRLGRSVGGVKIRKVESAQNKEKNVRGFPTMVFRDKEGNESLYEGERTHSAIRDYILSQSK
jgi:thiol-disulfide isomerase/thioredoxin